MTRSTALGLLLLAGGCQSGPTIPELVEVTLTAVGTITWEDGSPIAGAIVSSPPGYFNSSVQQTVTGLHGSYSLTHRTRCTPGGAVSSINVGLPPTMASRGGSCTGVPTCESGTYRRDCVFEFAGGG